MADWTEIGEFGTGESGVIQFEYRVLGVVKHPATVKRKSGSQLVQNQVVGVTDTDNDINLEIFLFGTLKPYINSGLDIDTEESRLVALRDQLKHTLNLGKYTGDYILSEANEDIEHNNNHPGVKKFNCTLLQRQL